MQSGNLTLLSQSLIFLIKVGNLESSQDGRNKMARKDFSWQLPETLRQVSKSPSHLFKNLTRLF